MRCQPLAAGENVTFRLVGADKIDPIRKRPIRRSAVFQPGREFVFDPFAGKHVTIGNVKAYRPVEMPDHTYRDEPITEDIWWDNTNTKVVNVRQDGLYEFLKHSNYNASNPHRDENIVPLFYEVDSLNAARNYMDVKVILIGIQSLILSASRIELVPICKDVNVDHTLSAPEMKGALMGKLNDIQSAKPVIQAVRIQSTPAKDLKTMVLLYDARKADYIRWIPQSNRWRFNDSKATEIALIKADEDPIVGLVNVLKKPENKLVADLLEDVVHKTIGVEKAAVVARDHWLESDRAADGRRPAEKELDAS